MSGFCGDLLTAELPSLPPGKNCVCLFNCTSLACKCALTLMQNCEVKEMYYVSSGLINWMLWMASCREESSFSIEAHTQQASKQMVSISSQACCNLHQAWVALWRRGFAHDFWCTSSHPCRSTMSKMKSSLVIWSQLSLGLGGGHCGHKLIVFLQCRG